MLDGVPVEETCDNALALAVLAALAESLNGLLLAKLAPAIAAPPSAAAPNAPAAKLVDDTTLPLLSVTVCSTGTRVPSAARAEEVTVVSPVLLSVIESVAPPCESCSYSREVSALLSVTVMLPSANCVAVAEPSLAVTEAKLPSAS